MSETPQLLLAHHLKALKLPTFLREYDKLAQQCAAEGVDHPRYLLRLAELELIERERRTIERGIKEARLEIIMHNEQVPPCHVQRLVRISAAGAIASIGRAEAETPDTRHGERGPIGQPGRDARFA